MSSALIYFTQSELALAAYGNLASGAPNRAELEKDSVGMSPTQAEQFSRQWTVIAPTYTDPSSGLSVTVFAPAGDPNARYLAIRGTEPSANDLTTDGLLALGLPAKLNPQFVALKAKIDQWRNDPAVLQGKNFTVAGHSLGGYLAAAVKQQYGGQVTGAYLYNAPGVLGPIGNILSLFGLSGTPSANVWNLRGSEGLSLISALGSAIGTRVDVLTEATANPLDNHGIVPLTDSLAVSAAYAALAPGLGLAEIGALLDASGAQEDRSLEDALDALRILLSGNPQTPPTPTGARQDLYANLQALQTSPAYQALSGGGQLIVLANRSASSLVGTASQSDALGLATRYALSALNPFALVGADYTNFNINGALDLANPSTGMGDFTEKYLTDRAAFLARKLWFSIEDKNPVNPNVAQDPNNHLFENEPTYYQDIATGYRILQGGLFANTHVYAFGGNDDDTLTGQGVEDHLYGGAGNDTLSGGGGNDYLEGGLDNDTLDGGTGTDTYLVGQGNDTVTDSDGLGLLRLSDGTFITGAFEKGTDGRYKWLTDTAVTAEDRNGQFLITLASGATVTLDAFTDGDYGIHLKTPGSPPPNQVTGTAFDDNNLDGDTAHNKLVGGGGDDRIKGLAGRDQIEGEGGADILEGGAGADILAGRDGNDRLYGDIEIDLATAIANGRSDSATGQQGDWLAGGQGDDILIGGADNDVLDGDGKDDVLYGGAGAYAVRNIYKACRLGFSDGTPEARAHGPSRSRHERNQAAAIAAVARIVVDIRTMKSAKCSSIAGVSLGGTPANEPWKVAA